MALGCFISPGRTLSAAVERVQLAESLGYDSVYVSHIAGRDSLMTLSAYAHATERIRLGTGVIPIYTRTPAAMAQEAVSLDEISDGRLNLGLGVSHRIVVEAWHGQTIDRPLAETREYAEIVRAIFRGEAPPQGEKWRTHFRLAGVDPRPDIPIYLAGLSPKMLRLAGEIADGVILWLCNPRYVAEVVVPAVREGRERAGKPLEGFDIVAAVPSASSDPAEARDALRPDLVPYFGLPFYRAMIERSGFESDLAAFDANPGAAAISDAFLDELAAIGDVSAGIERYRAAGVTSPCVGLIPRTDVGSTLRSAVTT